MIDYKARIEEALKKREGGGSQLSEACTYSLMSGGKRVRPILTLVTAEAIGDLDVMPAALGVEFFHTSSLIADDLPCMDNDPLRRGKASLHIKFNEATAILASYTLIAAGYGSIHENGDQMRKHPLFSQSADSRAMECLNGATRAAKNATEGQFFDLFPPKPTLASLQEIIYKKTVTLFEISFLFGWLFGGGKISSIPLLKKCAYHMGMAFQVADDLEDSEQDRLNPGMNMAYLLGKERAFRFFQKEMKELEKGLRELRLWTQPFQSLYGALFSRGELSCGSLFLGS